MFHGMEQQTYRITSGPASGAPFSGRVRSEVDQLRQPAFLVKLPHFEADISAYAAAQGYAPDTAGVPTW